jgi:hypothetical protein
MAKYNAAYSLRWTPPDYVLEQALFVCSGISATIAVNKGCPGFETGTHKLKLL